MRLILALLLLSSLLSISHGQGGPPEPEPWRLHVPLGGQPSGEVCPYALAIYLGSGTVLCDGYGKLCASGLFTPHAADRRPALWIH